ncbi:MAG TPA: hypothetical protein VJP59_00530 [Gemmatimonadota bacterium]|nr:hypothetical protein [Gemmatimonadota bacterium]
MARRDPDRDPPRHPRERALLALAGGVLCFALARTIADPDLWGHVLFGGDLIRTGRVIRPDPYSYLSGTTPWINHEWLAEALFHLAFRAAGPTGLVLLKMAVGLIAMGLVLAHLLRRGLSTLHAVLLLLLAFALVMVGTSTLRPQIFTFLGLVLLLLALDAADHGRTRWLWGVPVVMAAWVNLHGGFLAGIALLLVWGCAHALLAVWRRAHGSREGPRLAAVGLTVVGGILATFANPFGVRLWHFLLETATVARPEITEWSQTGLATWEGICFLVLLGGCAFAMVARGRPPELPGLAIFLVLAFGALAAIRHLPLFGLAAPIVASDPLAALSQRRGSSSGVTRGLRFAPLLLLLLTAGLVALAIPWLRGPRIEAGAQVYPARAVGVLRDSGVRGNLAVHFDWGEYAIWHLAPALRVSVDGRRETVYDPEIYSANIQFIFGVGDWDRLLDDHPTDLALVPRHLPVYNLLLLKPGWSPVYEDAVAAVFARDGSPLAARIRSTPPPDLPPDGDGLRFPVAATRVR